MGPSSGVVWALDQQGKIYVRQGITPEFLIGVSWLPLDSEIQAVQLSIRYSLCCFLFRPSNSYTCSFLYFQPKCSMDVVHLWQHLLSFVAKSIRCWLGKGARLLHVIIRYIPWKWLVTSLLIKLLNLFSICSFRR